MSQPPHFGGEVNAGLLYHMAVCHSNYPAERARHARDVHIYTAAADLCAGRPAAVSVDLAAALAEYYDAAGAALAQNRQDLVALHMRDIRACSSLMRSMGLNCNPDDPASPLTAAIGRWKTIRAARVAPRPRG